jgi:Tol biopolymer transport system component
VGRLAVAAGLVAILLGPATVALAGPSPQRTVRLRLAATANPDGASTHPSLSADARRVAIASTATNLVAPDGNGAVSDVFVYDQATNVFTLASVGRNGEPADGGSSEPVLSADGATVVFTSRASNLVPDDRNDVADIFVSSPATGLVRVSVSSAGEEVDGASSEPDISADGRLVVFTSTAGDLTGHDTNSHQNVYVHDVLTGTTTLVSAARDGKPAAGDSSAPAISPDGGFVSFSSDAPNLVAGDGNHKQDVFVRDLARGTTQRVSVRRGGGSQNRGMAGGVAAISDVSRDGRYVAFESDATNLAGRDRNRRTDVFVRDTVRQSTRRISLSTTNEEAHGDSILPAITPDGRYVAFASRADDLVPKNTVGVDVFVRDVKRGATVLADVTSRGQPRGRELRAPPYPVRPAISADAGTVAFASSAASLAGGDTNRLSDVFLRRLTPSASATADRRVGLVKDRLLIVFRSADRAAGPLRCRLDLGPPTLCPLGGLLLPKLKRGSHVLSAYAGAPGSHYASRAIVIRITIGAKTTRVRVRNPADGF